MKILVTVEKNVVAPRFDLAREVVVFDTEAGSIAAEPRAVVMPRASAEELCAYILKEAIDMVICGGIESQYFEYLTWKNISVIDRIIGPPRPAAESATAGGIAPATVLR